MEFPLNDKKGTTITNAIQQILDESSPKPNKIWVDKYHVCCYRVIRIKG